MLCLQVTSDLNAEQLFLQTLEVCVCACVRACKCVCVCVCVCFNCPMFHLWDIFISTGAATEACNRYMMTEMWSGQNVDRNVIRAIELHYNLSAVLWFVERVKSDLNAGQFFLQTLGVCVYVCVRVCVRACACVCVCKFDFLVRFTDWSWC